MEGIKALLAAPNLIFVSNFLTTNNAVNASLNEFCNQPRGDDI